jgi:MFS family permease
MSFLVQRLLPAGARADASKLVTARGLRGFADGMVSVLLASYLTDLGFSAGEVGVLITGTLLGSAALTLAVGLLGSQLSPKQILLFACGLMLITGIGFASITSFWPLLLVAIVGTLNPSGGDVSVFLPVEQSTLTETIDSRGRTALFARYTLTGTFAAAVGALCAGLPVLVGRWQGIDLLDAQRASFLVYAVVAVMIWVLYTRLSVTPRALQTPRRPLEKSRSIVIKLSVLFSLDSLGGGFVVQSLLALWLFERFELSLETAGAIFFAAGLLSALSQLASPWLADRIGLIKTMAYTHLPANVFLMLAAVMPSAPLAVAMLLARQALSQMDVPARQSYVMSVVPPEERAAAASVTNVPRSLAAAFAPALGGLLLSVTTFGWPLILGGAIKIAYDVLLLRQFANVRPEEEAPEVVLTHSETAGVRADNS